MEKLRLHDLSNRTKLHFAGRQALWFLDQLVTNQVLELAPGRCRDALLLTPKGRILAMMRIASTEDGAIVDFESGEQEELNDFFSRRVFATKVTITDVTDDYLLWRVFGDPASIAAAVGASLPEVDQEGDAPCATFGDGLVAALPAPMHGCADVWVRSEAATRVRDALQADSLSGDEYQALRVSRGLPSFEPDLSGGYLPQEASLEKAVHFKKGCYLGQEAVAMTQRGKVKKRLRHLEFAGSSLAGEIEFGGQPAGTVTSAAGRFGIGMVRTSVAPDEQVMVTDGDASVEAVVRTLPGTVEGPSVPSAREIRERLRGTPGR